MLTRTFLDLPGIGKARDAKLRERGMACWNDVLTSEALPFKNNALHTALPSGLEESCRMLDDSDALWFSESLPVSERGRLYPHVHAGSAYVDTAYTCPSCPGGPHTAVAT